MHDQKIIINFCEFVWYNNDLNQVLFVSLQQWSGHGLTTFGRSLGKGRQRFLCACAIGVWCNSWTDFIALHTNFSSSLIIVGYEPDHQIFASYGPVQETARGLKSRYTGKFHYLKSRETVVIVSREPFARGWQVCLRCYSHQCLRFPFCSTLLV